MKVKLHILYTRDTNPPMVVTDEEYETYKHHNELCEKQNVIYHKDGGFMWYVRHTEIKIDTESAEYSAYFEGTREGMKAANLKEEYDEGYRDGYNEGFLDGLLLPEDEGASIQEILADFPEILEYFQTTYKEKN